MFGSMRAWTLAGSDAALRAPAFAKTRANRVQVGLIVKALVAVIVLSVAQNVLSVCPS
jgi:hypothetical protein